MSNEFDRHVDILIVGGGLIGSALMLALQNKGFEVLLLEAKAVQPQPFAEEKVNFDARTLALAPSTINILKQLQVWPLLDKDVSFIKSIHVSQQGHFGATRLQGLKKDAHDEEVLGAVVELNHINRALYQLLPTNQVLAPAELVALDADKQIATIKQGEQTVKIHAQLLVAADGGHSTVRTFSKLHAKTKLYPQQALVTNIGLQRPHQQCAFERFTRDGLLAMLPMTKQRSAMIWCLPQEKALQLQKLDETSFLKELQQSFGYRLGRLLQVGQRFLFPLQEIIMPVQIDWPLVFVGNAAHTLHPIAGQGFNLGIRDAVCLAQCIVQNGINANMLVQYQHMRQTDQTAIIHFTDGLIRVFGSRFPGIRLARSLGLMAFDNSQQLQRLLARYARGFGGIVPDLVCNIALPGEANP